MRINIPTSYTKATHEGGPAFAHITAEQQLRRSVLSCLLWEDTFYEDGQSIADRIWAATTKVPPPMLASLAMEARNRFHLRHVPLLLLTALAKHGAGTRLVSDTIEATISRADELTEFLAVYAKMNGVTPDKVRPKLSAQVKKGLARAMLKFSPYQLAKYNRDGAIKLRDVMFLVHPKPVGEQIETFKQLAARELASPDTWEVALSGGADKKATFERLLQEGKLGYLALLRNLRGMTEAGVDDGLIKGALIERKGAHNVLPFRYVAAARACPQLEPTIDRALQAAIQELPPLAGKTAVLVDVSGSMDAKLSGKSDLTRIDAACALASIINGDLRVFSFSNVLIEVPPRRGMSGVDAIRNSQSHQGTELGAAVHWLNSNGKFDRLIVITDEQSQSRVPDPVAAKAYMINVASYQNGVGYGRWTHIDGFSDQVLRFIHEVEGV